MRHSLHALHAADQQEMAAFSAIVGAGKRRDVESVEHEADRVAAKACELVRSHVLELAAQHAVLPVVCIQDAADDR